MKLFGTDGIRGKFNESPINHVQLVKIGYAFAKSLFDDQEGKIYISMMEENLLQILSQHYPLELYIKDQKLSL